MEKKETQLARLFHDTYEKLAPEFGYTTREDTKQFDENSPNGKLMIAVCKEVMIAKLDKAREEGWEKGRELADLDWEESELVSCLLTEQKRRQEEFTKEELKMIRDAFEIYYEEPYIEKFRAKLSKMIQEYE